MGVAGGRGEMPSHHTPVQSQTPEAPECRNAGSATESRGDKARDGAEGKWAPDPHADPLKPEGSPLPQGTPALGSYSVREQAPLGKHRAEGTAPPPTNTLTLFFL